MKLFRVDRTEYGYSIRLCWPALWVIVSILTFWGFAVHVADRLVFG